MASNSRRETQTGGREPTRGVIPGRYALSVGRPDKEPPTGWQWTPLANVARLESGHTPSRRIPDYWDGDIPWIGIRDATENHGRTIDTTNQTVTQAGIDNSSARVLPAGTVCLSRTASVGYVVVMGRPMATSQDFVNWVCSDAIDSRFLRYVLLSEHDSMLRFASGTTHQTIYYPEVKAFHVCLPPINEQRAIAHILGTLDNKIELNRRMSETLEGMARGLYKSWFVDFDPVRAKAEGCDPGLPKPLADLFPDSFEDSELGEIPEGWGIKSIGDLADVAGGTTPSTKERAYWEGGTHAWATPKDLSGLSVPVLLNTERRITDAGLSQIGSGLLPKGTVLLSSRAPIGYLAIAEIPVAINQGFIAMTAKPGTSTMFLLFWASVAHEEIVSRANGSTFLEISKANFRPIPVVTPSVGVMRAFEEQARNLYQRIVTAERDSRTLAAVRDTLLPKLVSGDLRVGNDQRARSLVI
jgi:type I restriction enzyme S subunit